MRVPRGVRSALSGAVDPGVASRGPRCGRGHRAPSSDPTAPHRGARGAVTTDCHTHISGPDHLSQEFRDQGDGAWGSLRLDRPLEEHWSAMAGVDRAIVLGFRAAASGWVIPNEFIAEYVRQHPEKLVGFAGIDLADPSAVEEVDGPSSWACAGSRSGPLSGGPSPEPRARTCTLGGATRPPHHVASGDHVRPAGTPCLCRPADIDEVAIRHPTSG